MRTLLNIQTAAVLTILLAAPAARAAGFEGVIEMKSTHKMGDAAMKIFVGKGGVKNEVEIKSPQFSNKMSILVKASNQDVAYSIMDATKSYTEIDLKQARSMRPKGQAYTAKKLGTEKVLGYTCQHAMLTEKGGAEIEVWTNKEILDYRSMLAAMGDNAPADDTMMDALKSVGADGFLVKMVRRNKADPNDAMTVELVKVDKKSLPPATFEIPAGYTKRAMPPMMGGPGGGQMPPDVAEKLKNAMKNMTPEQAAKMKAMLEAAGQQPPPAK